MPAHDTTLCVINYNGAAYLPATLDAVTADHGRFGEVLLIDNASTDESVALVRRDYPAVRVIERARNDGAGAARNTGYEAATFHRVLFIDNDVIPSPGCEAALHAALDRDPTAAIAMARVLYQDDPDTIQFDGASAHWIGLMSLHHADTSVDAAPSDTRPIDSLVTACFLIDRQRWGGGPLFDESFFYLHEDHELGLRTRLRGLTILAVPEATCLHRAGTPGMSLRETGRYTDVRIRNNILNRWLVVRKLYQGRTLVLLGPGLALFELVQLVGVVRKGWLRMWVRAWGAYRDRRATTEAARRAFAAERRLPDGAVLSGGPLPFTDALLAGRLQRWIKRMLEGVLELNWRLARRWLR